MQWRRRHRGGREVEGPKAWTHRGPSAGRRNQLIPARQRRPARSRCCARSVAGDLGVPLGEQRPHFMLFSEPFPSSWMPSCEALTMPIRTPSNWVEWPPTRADRRQPAPPGSRGLQPGLVGVALTGLQVDALVARVPAHRPVLHDYGGRAQHDFPAQHKTAMDCLEETLRALPKRDRKRAENPYCWVSRANRAIFGLLDGSGLPPRQEFLIRNLVGADIKRGPWQPDRECVPGKPSNSTCATPRPPARMCAPRSGPTTPVASQGPYSFLA